MPPIVILPLVLAQAAAPPIETVPVPPMSYPMPPPPPAPRMPSDYKPASPRGNPGNWVSSNDYPPLALRNEQEGVTRFRVTISPAGTVTECIITASSGSPQLDMTSCMLITRRGRFNPAIEGGNPTVGYWSSSVRWAIPIGDPLLQPSTTIRRFVVEADGTTVGCTIETIALGVYPYPKPCAGQRFTTAYSDGRGARGRRSVVVTTVTSITDVIEARAVGTAVPVGAAGRPPLREAPLPGAITRTFEVNPAGTVTVCRIDNVAGLAARQYQVGPEACKVTFYDRYHEPPSDRRPKRVTEVETITVQAVPTTP